MSITSIFNFQNAANYLTSNINISANKAILALVENTGQVFSQSFDSDSGFTYNSALSEFTGGVVRQKDQRPANSLIGMTYTSSKNSNWKTGSTSVVSAVDIGAPTLSGGNLICAGGNNGVYYEDAVIGNIQNQGSIKFKFTPNYSGTPSTNHGVISLATPASPTGANQIVLLHSASGGTWRFTARDSANISVHSAAIIGAAWNPTAGQEYEIELVLDTNGAGVRLFINGVLHGTLASTFTRTGTATRLYVGSNPVYAAALADFNDVILFSNVQHTSSYTPGYSIPEFAFLSTNVVLPAFSYTGVGTILEVESSTVTEVGSPRYTVAGLYWNGSAWAASNGTYAQASNSATIIANLPSLNVSGATSVTVSVLFTDSNSQSSVDLISVTVTGQKYSATGTLETVTALSIQELISFASTSVIGANSDVKFALKIDGQLKYWNGSAWVNSNGSAAQANSSSDLNTNLSSLSLGSNSSIKIYAILTTSLNTETSELSEFTVEYDFGGLADGPETCIVWGYYLDVSGQPVSGATVTFSLVRDTRQYKEASNNIIEKSVSVTTDANGYFETDLIRSSEFEGSGTYKIVIMKQNESLETSVSTGSTVLSFSVPDAIDKNITDLLTAV